MVKAFNFYKESSLNKIIINLLGKYHQEEDEFFIYKGKKFGTLFYYKKRIPNFKESK